MSKLICPPLDSTPRDPGDRSGPGRPLPESLLRDASRRLGLIAGIGALLWPSGTILFRAAVHFIDPSRGWQPLGAQDAIAAIWTVASLGLMAYARSPRLPRGQVLNLALGYQVFTAFGIGILWHWDAMPRPEMIIPTISWIGAIILLFAGVIPNPPLRTLVAGLISASMNPIGMVIARQAGAWEFGSPGHVVLMHYPDFMLVGVAVIISHAFTRLGQQMSRARELGSYRLGALIGKGGMGEVYHATHRMLARPAAIKLIRADLLARGDPDATDLATTRFRREAEVAAQLESPHTVAIYDFGVADDGTLYVVMELLHGLDLDQLVRRHGPLPPNRVIHLLSQACESLEEAHVRGMVHRDIKPANIYVGRLGLAHDFVKVLDFGLVKPVAPGRDAAGLTAEGVNPGTPEYLAPEVARGEAVDGRADLYALGCVGYYMLTGRPVFEAGNVYHMIARHLNDEPPPPSSVAAQPVPARLDAVILACLRKDRAQRPASAGDLRQALAAVPVEPWGEADARRWWAEHVAGTG